jgi:hypothetical protein
LLVQTASSSHFTGDLGIVLKTFLPYKCKISVLSRNAGKVNIIVSRDAIKQIFSPGSIVSFFYTASRSDFFVQKVEFLYVPMGSIEDLCWIHYLLEICYYFLPLNAACVDAFRLIKYALELGNRSSIFEPYFFIVKRICLVRLLMVIGFYPPNRLLYLIGLFDDMVRVSLDSSNAQKVRLLHTSFEGITDQMVKDIDAWVLLCLQEHSHIAHFKTLLFFYSEK